MTAGSVFLSATATGFEAGETKQAVAVAAGADLSGDVSAHTMLVAQPQDAVLSTIGAMHWYDVMPTSCGNCHAQYRVGF